MLRRLGVSFLWVLMVASIAGAQNLLPDAPPPGYTVQSVQPGAGVALKINRYTAEKTAHNWNVNCPGESERLGTMRFEYAPYTGDLDGGNLNDFGGAIIRGGFTKTNDECETPPGWSYRWLQRIVVSGDQTVDTIDGDPLYPDHTATGFDALLFDSPGRGPLGTAAQNISWRAESALVCVNDKQIKVIGAFTWGFDIVTNAGTTSVNPFRPQGWANAIPAGLSTRFTAEYGPSGTEDTGWTLELGCCCIPEPTTLLLLAVGPLLAMRRRAA
ncbi:MAG: hypothetical protein HY718_02300 [Planctomycetes bacterium]|nr:hypothetical protein [Planctomycetota bacterium]